MITGVPGTSVDDQRTAGGKDVLAKHLGIDIVAEAVGMWSQAVAEAELSEIMSTRRWDEIDGLWMQVGCHTANAMQLEAGKTAEELLPCAGEGAKGSRLQMLPAGNRGRDRELSLLPAWRAAGFLCVATLFRGGASAGTTHISSLFRNKDDILSRKL